MTLRATILASTLRPGQEAAYERDHARIPDDLMQALRAGGVRDWAIWRDGRNLLHIVDVDDYDVLSRALEHNAVNDRWQAEMAVHVESFQDLDSVPALRAPTLVWSMAEQRAAED